MPTFTIFTVKFRNELQRKLLLNYHLPSNLFLHYLVKSKCAAVQLNVYISKN